MTIVAGSSGTKGWTTRWTTAAGQTIHQIWNGTLSTDGPAVSVSNTSWNGTLPPNGTTKFGYLADGSPSTPALTCTSP